MLSDDLSPSRSSCYQTLEKNAFEASVFSGSIKIWRIPKPSNPKPLLVANQKNPLGFEKSPREKHNPLGCCEVKFVQLAPGEFFFVSVKAPKHRVKKRGVRFRFSVFLGCVFCFGVFFCFWCCFFFLFALCLFVVYL